MDIFNNQIEFSISTVALISIALIGFGLIIFAIILIRRFRKKQPKPYYGFLGKTLYSIITILFLGTILFVSLSNLSLDQFFDIKAKKNLQADIFVNTLSSSVDETLVSFRVIPYVNSKPWGDESDQFDIYWALDGVENYTFIESKKSKQNPSGIQKNISKGKYSIRVIIVYENTSYTFEKQAEF